ncbi:MAG TPA: hypothetical protein VMV17_25320 [Streptosporangiaceae bacterium]|nr:hypothetical protein [Streptosporangiaceae bacterium]
MRYGLASPQGVRGRGSDNATVRRALGWEPTVSLEDGLAQTYEWIADQPTQVRASAA